MKPKKFRKKSAQLTLASFFLFLAYPAFSQSPPPVKSLFATETPQNLWEKDPFGEEWKAQIEKIKEQNKGDPTKAVSVLSIEQEDGELFLSPSVKRAPYELIEACRTKLPAPTASIEIHLGQQQVFRNKGLTELNTNLPTQRGQRIYTFGTTKAIFDYSQTTSAKFINGKTYACLAPQIHIKLNQSPQTTHIAREVPINSCLDKEVMEHELKHVKINNDYLELLSHRLKQELEKKMNETRIIYGTIKQTENWLKQQSSYAIDGIMQTMSEVLDQMHYNLDTIEESERLLSVCNGEGAHLIKTLSVPLE